MNIKLAVILISLVLYEGYSRPIIRNNRITIANNKKPIPIRYDDLELIKSSGGLIQFIVKNPAAVNDLLITLNKNGHGVMLTDIPKDEEITADADLENISASDLVILREKLRNELGTLIPIPEE